MTAKDIEKLFIEELEIEEVVVWSYDEKSKYLEVGFIIDFEDLDIDNLFYLKSINKFGLPYQIHIEYNDKRVLKKISVNYKDNKFKMFVDNEVPNKIEKMFFDYLEEFFSEQFKEWNII